MKMYRVDYTTSTEPDKVRCVFIKAESMVLAKHKVANMPYCDWIVKKIEVDTEKNYEAWKKSFGGK